MRTLRGYGVSRPMISAATLVFSLGLGSTAFGATTTVHSDGRDTVKLELDLAVQVTTDASATPESIAKTYLSANFAKYGVAEDLSNLRVSTIRHSLLGTHVYFQQVINNIDVIRSMIVVSVDKANLVYRVYNNTFQSSADVEGDLEKKAAQVLAKDKAYDIAWEDLRVHGELQSEPSAKLAYLALGPNKYRLVYVTYLNVAAPRGAWEHYVDAKTGKVVNVSDLSLERIATNKVAARKNYRGPIADRRESFSNFYLRQEQKDFGRTAFGEEASVRAQGTGKVFDPDPRTTLNDNTLTDVSAPTAFDAAYFDKPLLDIELDPQGIYHLNGPWIKIAEFEAPVTAPSTNNTGVWNSKRGTNAFNDAMTYFHIDQSQRYIQSLGFTGERGIQATSIEVDTDGVGGDDNSHFIPSENRLAFGHGCVDDNEDADVILHEYGHAIEHGIIPDFRDGDAGAIGEGFGDYWAASYSLSTANGATFNPDQVFSWDGHGDGSCWPGRVLNATQLTYDHNQHYSAHAPLGGGFSTDELWSTPVFQAMKVLLAQGVPRSEIDQIVLEAHFGFGPSVKMREMAASIVSTAKRLHPQGAHANAFFAKFLAQSIVTVPHAVFTVEQAQLTGTGNNNAIDPGETIALTAHLKNAGDAKAAAVEGTLTTSSPLVSIGTASASFADMDVGGGAQNAQPFTFTVDKALACGQKIDMQLNLTNRDEKTGELLSQQIPFTFNTGVARGVDVNVGVSIPVPDNAPAGVTISIGVPASVTETVSANFTVPVTIEHSYIGDLTVELVSPKGTKVLLHTATGGSADGISGVYPTTLTPVQSLSKLVGEPLAGTWKLVVKDTLPGDVGKVLGFGVKDVLGYTCE